MSQRSFDWICHHCAADRGATIPEGHAATFHRAVCDWCGHAALVAGPRDFRPRPQPPTAVCKRERRRMAIERHTHRRLPR